jgi:hypothetical protein
MGKEVTMMISDPFVEDLRTTAQNALGPTNPTQKDVRRPVYGVVHDDETYGYVSVKSAIGGKAEYISIIDSSTRSGTSHNNHNFIISQLDMGFQEKTQIIQTFGQDYAFFYGQQPLVISTAGFLLNTKDFNWKNEWIQNYQKYLRGTACVRTKSRVYLGLRNCIYVGYVISTSINISAENPHVCGFSFQMLVTNLIDLTALQPRKITRSKTEVTDVGYTINSKVGVRELEYITKSNPFTNSGGDPIKYVDFQTMTVRSGSSSSGTSPSPSMDSINSTWWLPEMRPLTQAEALRELSVRKYRIDSSYWKTLASNEYGVDENGDPILGKTWVVPTRHDAFIAESEGKLLSSDPRNLQKTFSALSRTCRNEILVVNT